MKTVKLFIVAAFLATITACTAPSVETTKEYPMFWTWQGYNPKANFDSICNVISQIGIDGIMLNAGSPDNYRKAIPIANKYGIKVYAWMWSTNPEHDRAELLKEHPEWFSVNRNGESLAEGRAYVDYYKFMCPALPEVREYIKDKTRALCEVEGLEGISIDYHRFVDVILPTTLWPKYDVVQDVEYPEFDYGYHPAMIELFKEKYGYDPREQEDPSKDENWLQFRCDQITEVANEIAEVVHSYGKVMAASPFPTPEMSRKMVRQDWGKWNLDIVFPMVYHNFYTGDVSFISDCTMDNVEQKNPMTTLYCGMTVTDGPEMFEWMDAALNNGAQGIALFTSNGLRSPEVRAQFKQYADSMRNLRATKGLNYNPEISPEVDPFKNSGIMEIIDMRMKAAISLANAAKSKELKNEKFEDLQQISRQAIRAAFTPEDYISKLTEKPEIGEFYAGEVNNITLDLTDYVQVNEQGATKYYIVTDKNSGIIFNVDFYFYGGVISGWNVTPEEKSYKAYYKK